LPISNAAIRSTTCASSRASCSTTTTSGSPEHQGGRPQEPQRAGTKLIRVLEATRKGPQARLPAPD
jgi:hypothetical protein